MPEVTRELADALIEVVRERMTEQGLSLNRLAGEVGVKQPTLHRQLVGGLGDITIDEWDGIAVALGTSLNELTDAARKRV